MLSSFGPKAITTSALLVMIGALSGHPAVFAGTIQTRTFSGVITDTMCGASHKEMNVSPDAKCVLECIKADQKNRYALIDGKNLFVLSDQETPAKFAARRVKVTGQLFESTNVLKVDSIEPAN